MPRASPPFPLREIRVAAIIGDSEISYLERFVD